MNFVLERVTQPGIEPVSLTEAKQQCRVDSDITADDDLITSLIVVAREWVEDYSGRALIDQTWRLTVSDSWLSGMTDTNTVTPIYTGEFAPSVYGVLLRKSPIIALSSIVSVDSAGVETELDVSDYEVREANSKWPRIKSVSGSTFSTGTHKIVYRAGFADRTGSPTQDATVVPARYKHAIKLHVEAHYDRDQVMMQKLLDAAVNLIRGDRTELQIA